MAVKADITIDIDKQVGNLQNLTNIYNARVGDNNTPLTVLWQKNGIALNLKGLHAFIAGKVGDGSYNSETDKVDFPAGTPVVKYEDDGSGTLDNGQSGLTTLLIPKQMWSKTGLFAGYIGLKDENGSVFTSKDIFFKVLGNVLDAGVAINYFIGDFDEALAKAEKELEDKSANFDQTTTQALQDLHDKYLAEAQKAEDTLGDTQASIDANLAALKKVGVTVGNLQAQLDSNNLETKTEHNNDLYLLKSDIINRLGQLKHPTQVFDSLDQIKAKFPNGADGTMLTTDNGHVYVYNWNVNEWKDFGVFQAKELPPEVQNILSKSLVSDVQVDQDVKPPYDDLDTLPGNKIVTYGSIEGTAKVKNWPQKAQGHRGTIFSVSGRGYADGGGNIQFLMLDNGELFHRINWGKPASYSKWISPMITSFPIQEGYESIKPPYDDLDTLLSDSLIIYSHDIDKLKHSPVASEINQRPAGMVYTSHSIIGYGKFQLLVTVPDGEMFWRCLWYNGNTWINWVPLYQKSKNKFLTDADVSEEYQDIHKLKNNRVITYGVTADTFKKVLNRPSDNPATFFTINGSSYDDKIDGQVQIAVDRAANFYYSVGWAGRRSNWKKVKVENFLPSLSLFRSIGIIGDSYASGELAFDKYVDHYNISWGQILGRNIGAKIVNFSRGGQTTRGWLQDEERGLGLLNSTEPLDLYILCLGINDYSHINLGTESDMDNNGQSFYGYYAQIIKEVHKHAPNAKMVIATVSQAGSKPDQFNQAIINLASKFKIPYIELNSHPFFTSDFYLNHLHGGHPSGPVYAGMAKAYQQLIEQAMISNLNYFEDYETSLATDNSDDFNRINAKAEPAKQDAPQAQPVEPKKDSDKQ